MYHFLSLDQDQIHQRRQLLDAYATIAQLSALVPLLIIQAFFLTRALHRGLAAGGVSSYFSISSHRRTPIPQDEDATEDNGDGTPSSPYLKHEQTAGKGRQRGLRSRMTVAWRKVAWWCGEEVVFAECSRGQLLAAGLWAAWLVFLSFAQTGEDYLHLTKRLGLVAASQLPIHYMLSMKTPYSPLQLLTRTSHETLVVIHQLLGRIILLMFTAHVILYTNFFVLSNLLATKLTQAYILGGYAAFISFAVLGTTALSWVRHRNYRLFYIAHVVVAVAVVPALWIHVHHIRIFLYESLAVFILNQGLRALATRRVTARIAPVAGTSNLISISIPAGSEKTAASWQPGHHGYVGVGKAGPFQLPWARGNPFTLAVVPAVRPSSASGGSPSRLTFVARVLSGNTQLLSRLHQREQQHALLLEGPYGLATHAEQLLRADRILFVAGGVGGTFCVPLYRRLLADLSPSRGSARRARVGFLWVVRNIEEVFWAIPDEAEREEGSTGSAREGFVERLRVCVTGSNAGGDPLRTSSSIWGKSKSRRASNGKNKADDPDDDTAIELEERKTLLQDADAAEGTSKVAFPTTPPNAPQLTVHAGRPDLARAAEQLFSHGASEKVAVVVCGPPGLGRALRREIGPYVRRGREVWFWEERFAL